MKVLWLDTYKLKTIDGEVFINTWNIKQLRRFYPLSMCVLMKIKNDVSKMKNTFSYRFAIVF